MSKIQYKAFKFKPDTEALIHQANVIIAEYAKQGFDLTLRQLYYQFVARGYIENKQTEYKRLGGIINDARLNGDISWDAIVDRTRNLQKNSHWTGPHEIVKACASQFQIDKWLTQSRRVEVWIEKDALAGVIEGVCRRNDVSYFSCRGYTSQSEMWSAAMRLKEYIDEGQDVTIIHLGDHDPSGIDMSRDIEDRLRMFLQDDEHMLEVDRIALTMAQVRKFNPPPNPAKLTDARANGYIKKFGQSSWELDALDPRTLDTLINDAILERRDDTLWNAAVKIQTKHRASITKVAEQLEGGDDE